MAKFGAVDLSRHANLQRVFHIDTGINVKELPDYLQEEVKFISLTSHAIGGMLETAMTSMELPGREMGQRAADMILEDIEAADDEKPSVQHMVFGTKLIERETT